METQTISTPTRTQKDNLVLRASNKLLVVGHAFFAVIVPLEAGDVKTTAWSVGQMLGPRVIEAWAVLGALIVLAAIRFRGLRMVGGVAYASLAFTFGLLASRWYVGAFSFVVAVSCVLLAWTGIPEES